jgi:hypothetical protein
MATLQTRVQALEQAVIPCVGQLPDIVADDTPQAEIDRRLRAAGVVAYRFSDAVEQFV